MSPFHCSASITLSRCHHRLLLLQRVSHEAHTHFAALEFQFLQPFVWFNCTVCSHSIAFHLESVRSIAFTEKWNECHCTIDEKCARIVSYSSLIICHHLDPFNLLVKLWLIYQQSVTRSASLACHSFRFIWKMLTEKSMHAKRFVNFDVIRHENAHKKKRTNHSKTNRIIPSTTTSVEFKSLTRFVQWWIGL